MKAEREKAGVRALAAAGKRPGKSAPKPPAAGKRPGKSAPKPPAAEKRAETAAPKPPAGRLCWKPGNMVYPVPAALVTVAGRDGKTNIITIAWTGTVCTNPPMAYISVRPERYSYGMLRETGEFVINLATEELAFATDYCGVRSGRDTDKWEATGLTPLPATEVGVPLIAESPVNIECRVTEVKELGSHHLFLARVEAVDVDPRWLNEDGRLELSRAKPLAYCHGGYFGLSQLLGTFGYSVRKKAGKAADGKQKRRKPK